MKILHAVFLLLYTFITESLLYENKKENFTSLVNKTRTNSSGFAKHPKGLLLQRRQFSIPKATKDKAFAKKKNRNKKGVNSFKLSRLKHGAGYRRSKPRIQKHNRRKYSDENDRSSSTSKEMKAWKKEFEEDWMRLKQDALIQRHDAVFHGDEVGMVAARPWATPCGDPGQHDWPWGTCMLPLQCDAEYRIYRGDLLCGRTSLVCCSVQLTQHDMYQGLDLSFARTSSSSSDEKSKNDIDSHQQRRDKKRREKIRRYKKLRRQKKLIKKKIRSVVHEIRKQLNRAYRNTTTDHKIKIDELKLKIAKLKKQFREKRKIAKFRFQLDVDEIQRILYRKLVNLNAMNAHFLVNETFRAFLKRHNINVVQLRSLQLEYPNLAAYIAGDGILSKGLQQILDLAMLNETQAELVEASLKATKAPQIGVNSPNETKPMQLAAASFDEAVASPKETKSKQLAFDSHRVINPIQPPRDLLIKKKITTPTELPINKFKKKVLRKLEILPIDVSTSLLYTQLYENKTPPEVVDSDVESYVTEASSVVQSSTISNELIPTMEIYVAMEPEEMQGETRRSGRGNSNKGKVKSKKLNRQDYLEYDVEYGILYT